MRRRAEDLVHGADLHETSEVHHADTRRNVAHQTEIVRDHQVRRAERATQLGEEPDDRGLRRHVERRHRLVEHDELRGYEMQRRAAEQVYYVDYGPVDGGVARSLTAPAAARERAWVQLGQHRRRARGRSPALWSTRAQVL